MEKYYDIHLCGTKMTDEQFEFLADNILLGGTSHRYNAKKIEYDSYSNARADMRAAEAWLKAQGFNPIKMRENGDYHLSTPNGEYRFDMVWGTFVSLKA